MAPDLTERMRACKDSIQKRLGSRSHDEPFFAGPTGKPVSGSALVASFREVVGQAGIAQAGGVNRPRLHDLRGTFAVHRLLLWYERNADLMAKLPLLSTYLGHVGLGSSQHYLQLTKDMVGEITRRHQACFGYLIQEWNEEER